jgi:hypothetical protein
MVKYTKGDIDANKIKNSFDIIGKNHNKNQRINSG